MTVSVVDDNTLYGPVIRYHRLECELFSSFPLDLASVGGRWIKLKFPSLNMGICFKRPSIYRLYVARASVDREPASSNIAASRFKMRTRIIRLEGVILSSSVGAIVECLSSIG